MENPTRPSSSPRTSTGTIFTLVLTSANIILASITLALCTKYQVHFFIAALSCSLIISLLSFACPFVVKRSNDKFTFKLGELLLHLALGVLLVSATIHFLVSVNDQQMLLQRQRFKHAVLESHYTNAKIGVALGLTQGLICGVNALLIYKMS